MSSTNGVVARFVARRVIQRARAAPRVIQRATPLQSRRRDGFVLLEAVVALAIIGIFAVALLAATGTQVQSSNKEAVLLTARSLAEDRMEAIRLLDYEGMNKVPDSLKAGAFAPPFDAYEWTATVAPMKDEYDLFDVQIIVSSGNEAYPLRTLMHQPRPAAQAGSL